MLLLLLMMMMMMMMMMMTAMRLVRMTLLKSLEVVSTQLPRYDTYTLYMYRL